MTRFDLLQDLYSKFDTIYSGLLLFTAWVAGTGHLLDWMTSHHLRILVHIFWGLIIVLYVAGIIFVGLNFQ